MKTLILFVLMSCVPLPCLAEPLDVFRQCRALAEGDRSPCFAQAIEKAQTRFSEKRLDSQLKREHFAPPDVSGGMRSKSRELAAALNLIVGMLAPPGDRGYYDLICLVMLLEYSTQEKFWEIVDSDRQYMSRSEFDEAVRPLQDMCKKSLDPVVCNHGIEEFHKAMDDEQNIAKFATAIGRSYDQVMGIFARLVAEALQEFEIAVKESNPRVAESPDKP
ncbi:MAG: hypothetical protein J5861_03215 [Desulfovibrio sp.]|nr:hypothetical protein [Desulfovibrio sp.]